MRVAFVLRSTDIHPVFAGFKTHIAPSGAPSILNYLNNLNYLENFNDLNDLSNSND